MKRFLSTGVKPDSTSASKRARPKQQRLSQCKKVVKLSASKFVIRPEELQALRETLECTSSQSQELLLALRTLDCLVLHRAELTTSQVGKSVKKLRKHSCPEVSSLAARLTEKWREIVLAECRS